MRFSVVCALVATVGCSGSRSPDIASTNQAQIVTTTIGLRGTPAAVVSGAGQFPGVVVAESDADVIEFVGQQNGSFGVVGVTQVGPQPQAVAIGPEGQITSANAGDQTLSVFLPNENPPRVDTVQGIGNDPAALVYVSGSPASQSFTVARGDDSVTVNWGVKKDNVGNTPNYGLLGHVAVGNGPQAIASDPAKGLVYVANAGDGTISVIETAHFAVVKTIDLAGAIPAGIAINSATRRLWVALASTNEVLGIPIDNDQAPQIRIPVGHQPSAIAVNSNAAEVYVANFLDNTVSIVDEAFSVVSNVIPVGAAPNGVAVDPTAGDVYVTNSGDGTITAFHDPAFDTGLLVVPVRLCALQGSQYSTTALDSPASLLSLVERMNERVYLAFGSRVIFQPAPLPAGQPIPIIPGDGGGSVDTSNFGSGISRARDQCDQAWQELSPTAKGIPIVGAHNILDGSLGVAPIEISLVVKPDGTPESARTSDLCAHPRNIQEDDVLQEVAIIIDANDISRNTQFQDDPVIVLGHEAGHSLMLGHGDGLDDDRNGTFPPANGYRDYDSYCDTKGFNPQTQTPNEDSSGPSGGCPYSTSIMVEFQGSCPALQSLQIETLRDVGAVAPGATGSADPGGTSVNDAACPSPPCNLASEIAIRRISASETPNAGFSVFSTGLEGPLPSYSAEYDLAIDMDNDATTGCSVSGVGLPSGFVGAEFVASIRIDPALGVSRTLYACQGGAFVDVTGTGVVAQATSLANAESGQPMSGLVSIRIPDSLGGALHSSVRVEAMSRRMDGVTEADTLPHAGSDSGVVIDLRASDLPICAVLPKIMRPGTTGTVTFNRLQPAQAVAVSIAGETGPTTTTDGSGSGTASFTVPSNATPGLRLVSVGIPGSLNVAFCAVRIGDGSVTPMTVATVAPNPDPAGWNHTDVSVSLSASSAVGGSPVDKISYSATGAQPLGPTSSISNPTNLLFNAEGTTALFFRASDTAGLQETPESLTVRIDKTPPQITATASPLPNSFGWYGQSRTPVRISFSCNDSLSGILDCSPAQFVSSEGKNLSITGAATDNALNTSMTSATVNIDVTSPVVTYSGNAGVYTIDQDVAIACTATDNLSGVANSTCSPITGPAYGFNIGNNTFSSTATDFADNTGLGTTSFQVKVTYDSLCNVTTRFSSSSGIANSLCQKLSSAQQADLAGNATAKAGKLKAYVNQVSAQSGKAFTVDQANLLEKLVSYL